MDGDGVGDACDQDADNDGVTTSSDNCKLHVNTDQKDTDGDGVGDVCDNCPKHSNGNQLDDDESGFGNVCEGTRKDSDGDGIPNDYDNCPHIANAEQTDTDQDGTGDVCDNDKDGDNIADVDDNCVYVPNPDQRHTINYDMDARPVGLACVDDYDGDKVPDADDHCPFNSNLHMLTFKENQQVDLAKDDVSQADQPKARWRVNSNGRDVEQLQATNRPSLLLGKQSYSDVEYSGVLHVNTDIGDDYAGVVFGYQNNKRFYVIMWRNENKNYGNTSYLAGTRGIQIKRVNSNGGELGSALWFSSDTWNKVDLLWQDPRMVGWKHRESYIFKIQFQASLSRMRFKLQKGEEVISDSGYIHDELITGGRLGVYTHGQGDVIFSRLTAKCIPRSNMALSLNGNDSYVILPDLQQLQIEFSLMIKFWIKLPANYERTKQPIVCTQGSSLCIYLNDRKMTVDLSGKTVVGGEVAGDSWQHFTIRYDGQGDCKLATECNPEKQLTIFQNNIKTKTETIGSVAYNYKEELYIGTDKQNYMKGLIDELSFWWVTEEDSRVTAATKMAALSWPLHQHLVTAYYNMNQLSNANNTLQDQSEFSNHAKYFKTKFVESTSDYDRFRLTYPSR